MRIDFEGCEEAGDFSLHDTINVTPFIDVVLVLLIVFMVAAPLSMSVISVHLPSLTASVVQPEPVQPIYVTIQGEGLLYIGDKRVTEEDFIEALSQETQNNLETKIFIRADTEIRYGSFVFLLNQLRAAGYTKIGLVGLTKAPTRVD